MNEGEEVFSVVDEKDNVIGAQRRSILHSGDKLIHRAVHILVVNDAGKIAVQKRSRKKDLYAGTLASSASGHVEEGETYIEAAERELSEELPNVCGELREVGRFLVETGFEREWSALFVCRFSGEIDFDYGEAESVEYMSPATIKEKRKKGLTSLVFDRVMDEYLKTIRDRF
ncbi:MAG: NUDIX domain-containing protein [Candidatus Altiarchaeota archaeon]